MRAQINADKNPQQLVDLALDDLAEVTVKKQRAEKVLADAQANCQRAELEYAEAQRELERARAALAAQSRSSGVGYGSPPPGSSGQSVSMARWARQMKTLANQAEEDANGNLIIPRGSLEAVFQAAAQCSETPPPSPRRAASGGRR